MVIEDQGSATSVSQLRRKQDVASHSKTVDLSHLVLS
jgi:hypothetical protein